MNHVLACVWYYVGSSSANGWVGRDDVFDEGISNAAFSERYLVSLQWSLVHFSPSSAPVLAENLEERMFTIVTVIILWFLVFPSFLGTITATMTHLRNIGGPPITRMQGLTRHANLCARNMCARRVLAAQLAAH